MTAFVPSGTRAKFAVCSSEEHLRELAGVPVDGRIELPEDLKGGLEGLRERMKAKGKNPDTETSMIMEDSMEFMDADAIAELAAEGIDGEKIKKMQAAAASGRAEDVPAEFYEADDGQSSDCPQK
eukprot:gnl/TRDRNA2_/TRDRNA2_163671_c1_seq1.p1 gnl/TRDRNA2_/TRDRNA2_163671_c1~~gnl/TRDRNA2_/TRDRNA2_163671_c1_seq1.p1  ORF type:complete len:125 (+),score=41.61 gnl/TRDRNA2_/TRDRNA2_163671_c1_seq1:259-633(+)